MQDFFETFFSYFFTLFFNVFQYFQGFAGHRVAHAGWRFHIGQNRSICCGFSALPHTIYRVVSSFYFLPQQSACCFVHYLKTGQKKNREVSRFNILFVRTSPYVQCHKESSHQSSTDGPLLMTSPVATALLSCRVCVCAGALLSAVRLHRY